MKMNVIKLLSIIVVLTMSLTLTGNVIAAPLAGGPTISPSSGGGTATLTVIPVSKLPGTEANAAGTLFPVGHTSGDMVFSGSGVQVSGLIGSATLNMHLANYAQGWSGYIYQWLNETWVAIPTTVTQNTESNDGTASAVIYSDGIYALIVSYKTPEAAEIGKCKETRKAMIAGDLGGFVLVFEVGMTGDFDPAKFPIGTQFKYKLINHNPDMTFDHDLTGIVTIFDVAEGLDGTTVVMNLDDPFFGYSGTGEVNFTIRIFMRNCYLDINYPANALW